MTASIQALPSTSITSTPLALHTSRLEEVAAELGNECHQFDLMIESLYGDLERLENELQLRSEQLEEARRHLADRSRQLSEQRVESGRQAHQLEQQEAQLSDALSELRSLRSEFAAFREQSFSREEQLRMQLAEQLAATTAEREQHAKEMELRAAMQASSGGEIPDQALEPLLAEILSLRQEIARSSGREEPAPINLGPLEQQLAHLRTELAETRAQVASGMAERQAMPVAEVFPPEITQQLQGTLAWHEERATLEAELVLVRARAIELQETVEHQRRDLQSDRAQLRDELVQLRTMIEQQDASRYESSSTPAMSIPASSVHATLTGAELGRTISQFGTSTAATAAAAARVADEPPSRFEITRFENRTAAPKVEEARPGDQRFVAENRPQSAPLPASEPPRPASTSDSTPASDPVVSSVMAQFAKLQKDVAQRRNKKK